MSDHHPRAFRGLRFIVWFVGLCVVVNRRLSTLPARHSFGNDMGNEYAERGGNRGENHQLQDDSGKEFGRKCGELGFGRHIGAWVESVIKQPEEFFGLI